MDRAGASNGEGWPDETGISEFLDQLSSGGEDYRRLVERLPAIVYTAELGETGGWPYVSPQIESILGFTPEEWWPTRRCGRSGFTPTTASARSGEETARRREAGGAPRDRLPDAGARRAGGLDPRRRGARARRRGRAALARRPLRHHRPQAGRARSSSGARPSRRRSRGSASSALGGTATGRADAERRAPPTDEIDGVECGLRLWSRAATGAVSDRARGLAAGGERAPSIAPSGRDDSQAGVAARRAAPVIVDDWRASALLELPALRELELRSGLAVLIEGRTVPSACSSSTRTSPGAFSAQDVNFVQSSRTCWPTRSSATAPRTRCAAAALHDPLTGLPNRMLLRRPAARTRSRRSAASAHPSRVLFLDLDHFKLINDSLGHHAGDELLQAVAPRLRAALRPGDTVARFGGDEFAILVEDSTDEREAIAIAERIGAAFSRALLDRRRRALRHRQHRHRGRPAQRPRAGRRRAR